MNERVYFAFLPELYQARIQGLELTNMCYLCPHAPECAAIKRTVEQYTSAEGCTREDVPHDDTAVWYSLDEGDVAS